VFSLFGEDYTILGRFAIQNFYLRKHLKECNEYQKKHYDQGAKERKLYLGQAVWLHDPTRKIGVCSKLLPK
jgi:hypothetical protein